MSTTYTGSDLAAQRATQALNNLYRDLGTIGQLRAAFGTSKASIESCSATATIVMERISQNDFVNGRMSVMSKGGMFSKPSPMPMTGAEIVAEIMRWLEGPNVVYCNVSNDHHFMTLPMGDGNVAMVQAFQGSYHLVDWFEWRGFGLLGRTEYQNAMTDFLTSSSQGTWTAAAKTLFSFDLASVVPGGTVRTKAQVAQDMADWFQAKPYMKGYGYKPL